MKKFKGNRRLVMAALLIGTEAQVLLGMDELFLKKSTPARVEMRSTQIRVAETHPTVEILNKIIEDHKIEAQNLRTIAQENLNKQKLIEVHKTGPGRANLKASPKDVLNEAKDAVKPIINKELSPANLQDPAKVAQHVSELKAAFRVQTEMDKLIREESSIDPASHIQGLAAKHDQFVKDLTNISNNMKGKTTKQALKVINDYVRGIPDAGLQKQFKDILTDLKNNDEASAKKKLDPILRKLKEDPLLGGKIHCSSCTMDSGPRLGVAGGVVLFLVIVTAAACGAICLADVKGKTDPNNSLCNKTLSSAQQAVANTCVAGQYYDSTVNGCSPCPVDTYSETTGTIGECTKCPSGTGTNGTTGIGWKADCMTGYETLP